MYIQSRFAFEKNLLSLWATLQLSTVDVTETY